MENSNQTKFTLSLAGKDTDVIAGLSAAIQSSLQLNIPLEVSKEAITRLTKDCEILLVTIQKDPDGVQKLLSAIAEGKFETAAEIGKSLGLTEAEFVDKGGGMMWLLALAVGAAILLWPRDAN